MIPGYATPAGTAGFAARFPGHFYRNFDGLTVSTLGLGTYLGNPDDATDRAYEEAVAAAVRGGVNVLDAAINYRNQRSEKSIGAALARLGGFETRPYTDDNAASHGAGDNRASHGAGDNPATHGAGDNRASHGADDNPATHGAGDNRGSHGAGDNRGSHGAGDNPAPPGADHNPAAHVGAGFKPALFRDQVIVCTKAGFLTPGAVPSFLKPADVVGGMHSMTPEFLADQIERSRANLGLETIDVFYLHNPETQLGFVPRSEFEARIRRAYQGLEQAVAAGKIRYYGTATWNGYRVKPDAADALDLTRLIEIAHEAGGDAIISASSSCRLI